MNIFEKLSLCEYERNAFLLIPVKWGTNFIFQKKILLKIKKKLHNIVNIFVFFFKISCQSKESSPF